MILFKSKGQFLLLPAIGFVRDGDTVAFNISWLMFGLAVTLFEIKTR